MNLAPPSDATRKSDLFTQWSCEDWKWLKSSCSSCYDASSGGGTQDMVEDQS